MLPSSPPQQQRPHYQQPPPGGPRKSWPRRHKILTVLSGIIALSVIGGITSAAGGSSTSTAPAITASAEPSTPAAKPSTVATFTGSGLRNTPKFTVTDTWKLVYSFNCSSFGYPGNFIVTEDDSLLGNLTVNELALSKRGSSWAYGDAGTHYLSINSECAWKLKIIDEP